MLSKSYALNFPRLGVAVRDDSLLHSRFRLFIRERNGVIFDQALVGFNRSRGPWSERHSFILQLEGDATYYISGQAVPIEEGAFVLAPWGEVPGYRHEGRQLSLVLDWEPGSIGGGALPLSGPYPLPQTALERVRRVVEEVRQAGPGIAPASSTAQILALLRNEGLPFDPFEAGELDEPAPERLRRLSQAFDQSFASIGQAPAMIDLERSLGWSRQRIHTISREFFNRYAFKHTSWRTQLHHWRLTLGIAMMSAPKATTEQVAAELGYSSATNFCNTFANAGLPSPGNVRRTLAQLG